MPLNLPEDYLTANGPLRALIEVAAVWEDDFSKTELLNAAPGYCRSRGLKYSPRELKQAFTRLQAHPLLLREKGRMRLRPGIEGAEPIIRHLRDEGYYEPAMQAVDKADHRYRSMYYADENTIRRLLRQALYEEDQDEVGQLLSHARGGWEALLPILALPLDRALLAKQSPAVRGFVLQHVTGHAFLRWYDSECRELAAGPWSDGPNPFALAVARQHLLEGRPDEVLALEATVGNEITCPIGLAWFQKGDIKKAVKSWASAVAAQRRVSRQVVLLGLDGWLLPLGYWLSGMKSRLGQAEKILRAQDDGWERTGPVFELDRALYRVHDLVTGGTPAEVVWSQHPVAVLVDALVEYWTGKSAPDSVLRTAIAAAEPVSPWVAAELKALAHEDPGYALPGTTAVMTLREVQSDWERQLDVLEAAFGGASPPDQRRKRVAWFLTVYERELDLEPRLQTKTRKGWSSGRAIALGRFLGRGKAVSELTPEDHPVAKALRQETYGGWRGYDVDYSWSTPDAWLALVGHPAVFDGATGEPLDVVARRPSVTVQKKGRKLTLALDPPPTDSVLARRVSPARWEVISFAELPKLALRNLKQGITVPAKARDRLAPLLGRLAETCLVQDEAGASDVDDVPADGSLVVQLRPQADGVAAVLCVQPLGGDGPRFYPGLGPAAVLGEFAGQMGRAVRDLADERRRLMALGETSPVASDLVASSEGLVTADLEETLELLDSLAAVEGVRVEWPEGEKLRLRSAKRGSLQVNVSGGGDWFSVTGNLKIDEELVVSLEELVDRIGEKRFVRLGDDEFLALTGDLRARLAALARAGKAQKNGLKVHRLAGPLLEPVLDGADRTRLSKTWKDWARRTREPVPEVSAPRTLEAELRPYQLDGLRWMVERGALGAGVCLADDMGLGKTVQTLALLLHRGAGGPALVVAPTSVCGGWESEGWRFAPTLTMHRFGQGDREEQLASLGPLDVVICSYGLLQTESERLSAIQWHTLVLDEAQAIKNRETKRHKAVRGLTADMRVALTGTPIENHLGDLWSLFEVLNPGLLGSWKRFRDRWAGPVESGDREAATHLRKLVLPFVLRRTKSAVLDDLPPRTEITVEVEFSPEERAFYEALRRRALMNLDTGEVSPLAVLAELTRLRLACCNPALVAGDVSAKLPDSAKLTAFMEIVERLLEGGHRALVFSQFVKHLDILRSTLDGAGVAYQYLDGSTPAKQRDQRVRAFQSGEGDLFLISLKAGGTGLNLTGADYVIHMDPWWNPAVEDQASDRAHRIGQRRPVTVYRLVAKDTVEERITALHHHKRDLADRLLTGADSATRLDTAALLKLLRSDEARP